LSRRKPATVASRRGIRPEVVTGAERRRSSPELRHRTDAPRVRRRWAAGVAGLLGLAGSLLLGWLWQHRQPRPTVAPAPATTAPLPSVEQGLRDAVARQPRDPVAHRALARYLLDQRRPFSALWHFRQALDLQPGDPDTLVGAARALTDAGLPEQAVTLLRARLAAAPSDLEARRALAETELATARPRGALAALTGAGAALAASAPAQRLLGDIRVTLGDLDGAKAAYQRATALEPEAAAGYDRLGRLALSRRDWGAAQAAFSDAAQRDPGKVGPSYRSGLAYWGAGKRDEAEQLWAGLAPSWPAYAPIHLALGQALADRHQWDAAAPYLVAAVNADPASREAQFTLARVMTAQGDRASAAYQRGFYYLQTDRPHLALAEFRKIQALAPRRVDGSLMTAMAYIKMKRLDLGAVEAERGLADHPRDSRLMGQLGLVHILGRNRPLAQKLCEDWVKARPQDPEPYRLLGRIAREDLRLPESLQYCEQAMARDSNDAGLLYETSRTLAALPGADHAGRALELARRATELAPKESDYWQQFGTLLRAAGRQEEAGGAFQRALDLDPLAVASCTTLVAIAAEQGHPDTSRFFARLVSAIQDRRRTSETLWRAVYLTPQDPTAHERLAHFLIDSGNLRRASYQLEAAADVRPADPAIRQELALLRRLLALQEE
jgi:tetratricopeptide (TPR) repeat protein